MPSSSLCSHALVLDTQGFGAFGNTKANRHKIKNEPGGNDRSPQVNDYVKKLGQCHILIRGLTRRISLRTIETALPETANPNETVPVNTGHCLRLLPFPQGMTVEWLACASTKAADRQKANIMSKKEISRPSQFFISDGSALKIYARSPKNQFPIPFCVPVLSWALEITRL